MGHVRNILWLGLFFILGGCFADPDPDPHDQNQLLRKLLGLDRPVYAGAGQSFPLPDGYGARAVGDQTAVHDNEKQEAVAVLQGQSRVRGVIHFTQDHSNDPVTIEGTISGLAPGLHGFHVHERGDLTNGCASTESHFNPHQQTHGAPTDRTRHVGDLGNVRADAYGVANFIFSDHIISLSGTNSVLGRAILVHQMEDDLGRGTNEESLLSGNAGARLACGVIGVA